MTNNERRNSILAALTEANGPLNATKLADMHSVTRQIIVADIALLRAAGNNIRAEHKGYVLDIDNGDNKRKIVCRLSKDATPDELYAIVDNGGKILDVQVEHSVYGMISGNLDISSRYDVDQFIEAMNKDGVMHEDAAALCLAVTRYPNLSLKGLMTMAPVCEEKSDYRKYFDEISALALDIWAKTLDNKERPALSMGMSGSFPEAIASGATAVRVGRRLFEK